MGGVGQGLLQTNLAQMQGATQQGIGLMGQGAGVFSGGMGHQQGLMGMQQGLDENLANSYIGRINAHNARRDRNSGMAWGLVSDAWSAGLEKYLPDIKK